MRDLKNAMRRLRAETKENHHARTMRDNCAPTMRSAHGNQGCANYARALATQQLRHVCAKYARALTGTRRCTSYARTTLGHASARAMRGSQEGEGAPAMPSNSVPYGRIHALEKGERGMPMCPSTITRSSSSGAGSSMGSWRSAASYQSATWWLHEQLQWAK